MEARGAWGSLRSPALLAPKHRRTPPSPPPRAPLPPARPPRLRLYTRVGVPARTGAVLRDGRPCASYLSGAAAVDKVLAVQLLPREERLEEDALLLAYLLLDAAGATSRDLARPPRDLLGSP